VTERLDPKDFARKLRRDMTDAERRLWGRLRRHAMAGAHFRRQHPIGKYVADFVCVEALLVIEVDGGQHAESDSDVRRTEWLKGQGFEVLRFWNQDVLRETQAVCEMIFTALQKRLPAKR
jgi:BirA family biotin operon repressor/biotin-[acetyl-CoA-carboxylase] ligase